MQGLPAMVTKVSACAQAGRWECARPGPRRGNPRAVAAREALVRAGAAPAAAPAEEPEEAAPKVEEKTLFSVKLESIDAGSKPKIIKEIKAMLGLSLVDSKKFVERAPKLMKEGVPKEEAEKMIELMKSLGAVAKME